MAEDKTDKPEKTTEKREIIGKVLQITDEGKTLKLKLEESDGSSWDWKTFHASGFRGKIEFDKTYKFEIALVHEQGRPYPWRNLNSLIGPAEMPASGEMTSRPVAKSGGGAGPRANGSGGGRSIEQTIVTRNSIEAGNAVNMVIELLKLGYPMEEIPAAIEDVTANADKLIDWMSGHWVELAPPAAAVATNGDVKKPASKTGNAAKAVDNPTNLGELLNTCMAKWALKKNDVEAIVEMDAPDITDFAEALKRVGYEMEQKGAGASTAA
jgi:hypothetical protein